MAFVIYVILFCTIVLASLILWTRPRKGFCEAHRKHIQREAALEKIIEELFHIIARQVAAAAKDRGLEATISKPEPLKIFGHGAKKIEVRIEALKEPIFTLELLWGSQDYTLNDCKAWFHLRQKGDVLVSGKPFIVFCEKNIAEEILMYLPLLSPTHYR